MSVGKVVFLFAPRVCAHCGNRHDPPEWRHSLFRSFDALYRIARLTVRAAEEVRFAERVRATDPRGARQHLRVAAEAIWRADGQRELLCNYLILAGTPGAYPQCHESHVASCVRTAFERGMDAGAWLDEVAERLKGLLASLPAAPDADDAHPRRFLALRQVSIADQILALFKRRQRWKTAAPEDAPRRISRGRAPPSLELCAL